MCGIAGAFGAGVGRDGAVVEGVRRMAGAQTHRGPDDSGWLQRDDVVLGHNRLSIIDLSPCGHQPMTNETGTVWACFNGEIYNYQALRAELEALGHRFASHSDTEVLVHGYEAWGVDGLVTRLRGMFAFALYDEPRRAFFLARDRFGIKPLYYAALDGADAGPRVLFASEVRSLARSGVVPTEGDARASLAFLLFGSIPAPWTTLRAVLALPPAHYLTATPDGVRLARYYDLDALFVEPAAEGARNEAAFRDELRGVLEETVDLHLLSDAPLGVFLSGGIDSSALVALTAERKRALDAQTLRTVSIVFEEAEYSEERYQQAVVDRYRTDHYRIPVTRADFRAEAERFLEAMDQPTIDGLNTYFVAGAARQAGLKAVLAGIGGDEVFAGYGTLGRAPALRRLHDVAAPLRRAAIGVGRLRPAFRRLEFLKHGGAMPRYLAQRGLYTPSEAARLLGADESEAWRLIEQMEPGRSPDDPVAAQQFLEARHYLVDQLLKDADVFGMAHSLEIRVPFLDHVLAETVLRAPMAWRRDPQWPKPLLSRTLADLLPREVVFRRKQGFVFPIGPWLRDWSAHAAAETPSRAALDRRAAGDVWRELQSGRVHWTRPWALYVLGRMAA